MAPRRQAALAAAAVSTFPSYAQLCHSLDQNTYPHRHTRSFVGCFHNDIPPPITARILFHCHLPHALRSSASLLCFICWLLPSPRPLGARISVVLCL
ncbi:hypothetical protein LZ30DRAFT_362870 [Colletotrichum cereale]|nr:hypothetical protein LZ30DRAFT_362870 [Colletotrichum cereale]